MNINVFKIRLTNKLTSLCDNAEIIIHEEEQISVAMKVKIENQLYGDYIKISHEELKQLEEQDIDIITAYFAGFIKRVYEQDFYRWLIDSMFNDNCRDDVFCEVCLRHLEKLGYVEVINGKYQKVKE